MRGYNSQGHEFPSSTEAFCQLAATLITSVAVCGIAITLTDEDEKRQID